MYCTREELYYINHILCSKELKPIDIYCKMKPQYEKHWLKMYKLKKKIKFPLRILPAPLWSMLWLRNRLEDIVKQYCQIIFMDDINDGKINDVFQMGHSSVQHIMSNILQFHKLSATSEPNPITKITLYLLVMIFLIFFCWYEAEENKQIFNKWCGLHY